MSDLHQKIIIIFDDREFASEEIRNLIGLRRFGDVVVKRRTVIEQLQYNLPEWARKRLLHLRTSGDLLAIRAALEASSEDCKAFIIAARAGFAEPTHLSQLVERLPYAEEDFTDRLYKPLLVFLRNAHDLIRLWPAFEASPMHCWEQAWQNSQRVQSVQPLDLAKIRDFMLFTSGSTASRHFNQLHIDTYYYTKSSRDKRKILAEYLFYGLVPEQLRPWLIQPFDYQDNGDHASYKTLRYYLADAAMQWVHGAFDEETFEAFVERILFFLQARPRKSCSREQSAELAQELFITKVDERARQFLAQEEGKRVNSLVASATPSLALERQLERYRRLYKHHERSFAVDHLVVGHGDPCFSNILYDQQRYILKLIDPKGAVSEHELWTHPLYDLCKVSHSALGDYDFINNGLYKVNFSDNNDLMIHLDHTNHATLKSIFRKRVRITGHDDTALRLGEASLFLSMLPLHLDYPNKVVAFLLIAKHILDEVENGRSI